MSAWQAKPRVSAQAAAEAAHWCSCRLMAGLPCSLRLSPKSKASYNRPASLQLLLGSCRSQPTPGQPAPALDRPAVTAAGQQVPRAWPGACR